MVSCCFDNEVCGGEWEQINDDMTKQAIGFMKNPKLFLTNLVENTGYDTCHRTSDYDAEECHKDCQIQEKSEFAKNCTEGGGLYKCCIR